MPQVRDFPQTRQKTGHGISPGGSQKGTADTLDLLRGGGLGEHRSRDNWGKEYTKKGISQGGGGGKRVGGAALGVATQKGGNGKIQLKKEQEKGV